MRTTANATARGDLTATSLTLVEASDIINAACAPFNIAKQNVVRPVHHREALCADKFTSMQQRQQSTWRLCTLLRVSLMW